MTALLSRARRTQPPVGAPAGTYAPRPTLLLRPLGARHAPSAAIASSTYSGVTADVTARGRSLRIAGGSSDGILHTLVEQPDRNAYTVAVVFQIDSLAANSTIFGVNGILQVRVNTSGQVELLWEGSALWATSTRALYAGSIATLVVSNRSGGPLTAYVNGESWVSYAGGQDIYITDKYLTLGRRNSTGEVLTGHVVEAAFWSGWTAEAERAREVSREYFARVFAPRDDLLPPASAGGGLVALTLTAGVTASAVIARAAASSKVATTAAVAAKAAATGAAKAAGATTTAAVARSTAARRSATTTATATLTRGVAIMRSATTTLSATLVTIKAKLLALSATVTTSATVKRSVQLVRTASAGTSAGLAKLVSMPKACALSVGATVQRAISAAKSATAAAGAALSMTKVKLLTLVASVVASAGLRRAVSITRAGVTVASASAAKLVRKALIAAQSLLAALTTSGGGGPVVPALVATAGYLASAAGRVWKTAASAVQRIAKWGDR